MFINGNKYMKIQSAVAIYYQKNFYGNQRLVNCEQNINYNEQNNVLDKDKNFKQIPLSLYNIYFPNFTSKTQRICSSNNIDLQEKSGDFKLARFSDIPCPACGKKMMTLEKFNEISNELLQTPNDNYLEVLKKYKEYMRPVEESVFKEIYELSLRNGESKDIRTLLVNLRDKKLPILQKVQMKQVKKMTALAKTLPPDERVVLV